jgi:hydroxyacylglutathione hydrolase
MLLKRLYDDTLAQASYLVGCERTKTVVVIDPNRDTDRYMEAAKRENMRIAYVTETHIHADFVSGARDLARRTGATLLLSAEGAPDWAYGFAKSDGATLLRNGDRFDVGGIRFEVRHTPGHTPEHICFLVTDTATSDRPVGMFSGDFIFAGDVGRPDLLERAASMEGTMEALARQLFRSLRAMSALPDYLQIWPGHGAGSACGKSLGAMPSTTLGYERIANWAFQIDDEAAFVREALAGQPEPPKYFARMKVVNRDGPTPAESSPLRELELADVQRALEAGDPVVDVRATVEFARGHVPGTINIPTGTSFATWAGSLLPYDRGVILLADDADRIAKARLLLSLIGIDRIAGFAGARVRETWARDVGALQSTEQIDVATLATSNHRMVVDVRRASEWNEGHMPNATHLYLGNLAELTADLPRDTPIALHCQGGTRSAIAASLLQAKGFTNVANVAGGFDAWRKAGLPVMKSEGERAVIPREEER